MLSMIFYLIILIKLYFFIQYIKICKKKKNYKFKQILKHIIVIVIIAENQNLKRKGGAGNLIQTIHLLILKKMIQVY